MSKNIYYLYLGNYGDRQIDVTFYVYLNRYQNICNIDVKTKGWTYIDGQKRYIAINRLER